MVKEGKRRIGWKEQTWNGETSLDQLLQSASARALVRRLQSVLLRPTPLRRRGRRRVPLTATMASGLFLLNCRRIQL